MQKVGLAHGIGLTKVGRNTKLHAVCGAKDRPVVLPLTPGNVQDYKVAQLGIDAMPPPDELVADKGYDSQALREWLVERGTQPVVPPRKNRKIQYDYDAVIITQAQHHRAQVLQARGTVPHAIRFDLNIKSFLGAIALVASLIWWL